MALHAALAVPGRAAPGGAVGGGAPGLVQAKVLAGQGVEILRLPVDAHGVVRCETLPALLEGGAALVSVMAANNETGVIQPVAEVLRLASAAGVPVHVDATQAAGRIPVDFAGLGALPHGFGHKLHGPKGVGVLVVKKGAP
jgi:cysteine desulfurase